MPEMDIDHVAHLARLELTAAEKQQIGAQLQDILAYVAKLNQLDVTGVEPTAHATPLQNVLRPDEARPCGIEREQFLKNAPEQARGLFIVPKIIE